LREEDVSAHVAAREAVDVWALQGQRLPSVEEYLAARWDTPLWKPPGVEMSYCPYGYELLGQIVVRVSGRALEDLARERIFCPLGMEDTSFVVPEGTRHQVVRRAEDHVGADLLNSRELQEEPYANFGAFGPALDMARVGQLFLDGGAHGEQRLFGPAAIAEMTRNQIGGLSAWWEQVFLREAGWSYAWSVRLDKRGVGVLSSSATLENGGYGGLHMWVDPASELIGVYFSVQPGTRWCADLFADAVTAAVVDL
jgi:CubicO group peptidase (beta-lactamase class C family)